MKQVYIDEDVTPDLAKLLPGHSVGSARSLGLHGTKNGALMRLLAGKFNVVVTRDRKMQFQQNLKLHGVGLVVLRTKVNTPSGLSALVPKIAAAIERVMPGEVIEVVDDDGRPAE